MAYLSAGLTLIFLLGALLYVLANPISRYSEELFSQRWGAIYEDIKPTSKFNVAYVLIFCLRRIIFCINAFYLGANPIF